MQSGTVDFARALAAATASFPCRTRVPALPAVTSSRQATPRRHRVPARPGPGARRAPQRCVRLEAQDGERIGSPYAFTTPTCQLPGMRHGSPTGSQLPPLRRPGPGRPVGTRYRRRVGTRDLRLRDPLRRSIPQRLRRSRCVPRRVPRMGRAQPGCSQVPERARAVLRGLRMAAGNCPRIAGPPAPPPGPTLAPLARHGTAAVAQRQPTSPLAPRRHERQPTTHSRYRAWVPSDSSG